jgi:hypothetical protein
MKRLPGYLQFSGKAATSELVAGALSHLGAINRFFSICHSLPEAMFIMILGLITANCHCKWPIMLLTQFIKGDSYTANKVSLYPTHNDLS